MLNLGFNMKYSVFKKSYTPNVKLELVQSMDYLHELDSSNFVDKVEVMDMVTGESIHSDNIVFVDIAGMCGSGKTIASIYLSRILSNNAVHINDIDVLNGDIPRIFWDANVTISINQLIPELDKKLKCYVNGKLSKLSDIENLYKLSTDAVFIIKTHQLSRNI